MRRVLLALAAPLLLLLVSVPAASADSAGPYYRAMLSGEEEVPPVDSEMQGRLFMVVDEGGESIRYRLGILNADRLTQAHIHLGELGTNGPVVAFLFGPVKDGVSAERLVVGGTITEDDLVGPLKGHPLSDLIDALNSGGAYANAHTVAHPAGEIRGQIEDFHAGGHGGDEIDLAA